MFLALCFMIYDHSYPQKLLVRQRTSFLAKRNSVVYSANNQKTFLEARLEERSNAQVFSEWERDILENNDQISGSSENNNYTDMVGKGLLQEYFRARESNIAINEEKIASDILAMTLPEKYEIEYKEYEVKDLNISSFIAMLDSLA